MVEHASQSLGPRGKQTSEFQASLDKSKTQEKNRKEQNRMEKEEGKKGKRKGKMKKEQNEKGRTQKKLCSLIENDIAEGGWFGIEYSEISQDDKENK